MFAHAQPQKFAISEQGKRRVTMTSHLKRQYYITR